MNKKSKTQIAIGYARTANETNSNEPNSIENQEKQIKEYCRKNGFELIAIFIDPKMADHRIESIARAYAAFFVTTTTINHLVCADRSRVSRSAIEFQYAKALYGNEGVKLHTVNGINPSIKESIESICEEVANRFNSFQSRPSNKVVEGK